MSNQQTLGGANGGFAGHSGARSASRYGDPGLAGFISRSFAKSMGFSDEDLRKPVIGIAQTWSEFNNCHQHFKELAEAVKRGVWQAGGLPLEFPTISLGEIFLSPTSMFFRNLMAIDTEEMIRAQPMNGVVLLGACDKTIPAQLMGAASADIPTIMITGSPTLEAHLQAGLRERHSGHDGAWRLHQRRRPPAGGRRAPRPEHHPGRLRSAGPRDAADRQRPPQRSLADGAAVRSRRHPGRH